jgi:hypothetical protein
LPSRPLLEPRTTMTSSWEKSAYDATGGEYPNTHILADGNAAHSVLLAELLTQRRLKVVRTCLLQCSKTLHTLMMTRRTLLGALKCAFRDLRRELATIALTLVIFAVELAGCRVSRQSSCRDHKIGCCEMCLCWGGFASLARPEKLLCRAAPVGAASRVCIMESASPRRHALAVRVRVSLPSRPAHTSRTGAVSVRTIAECCVDIASTPPRTPARDYPRPFTRTYALHASTQFYLRNDSRRVSRVLGRRCYVLEQLQLVQLPLPTKLGATVSGIPDSTRSERRRAIVPSIPAAAGNPSPGLRFLPAAIIREPKQWIWNGAR